MERSCTTKAGAATVKKVNQHNAALKTSSKSVQPSAGQWTPGQRQAWRERERGENTVHDKRVCVTVAATCAPWTDLAEYHTWWGRRGSHSGWYDRDPTETNKNYKSFLNTATRQWWLGESEKLPKKKVTIHVAVCWQEIHPMLSRL